MSIQQGIIDNVDEVFEVTLSPKEFPNINKQGVFTGNKSSGYRNKVKDDETVQHVIRVEYETHDTRGTNIRSSDARFMVRTKDVTNPIVANATTLTWGGKTYNLLAVTDIAGICYDIQGRLP